MRISLLLGILCVYIGVSQSVDRGNFKTCEQASFCKRARAVQPGDSKFALVPGTLSTFSDSIVIDVVNKEINHLFVLKLEALKNHNFRLQIDEKTPLKPRYRVTDALKENPTPGQIKVTEGQHLEIVSGPNKVIIHSEPLQLHFYQNNVNVLSLNGKGLMKFEHLRTKPTPPEGEDQPKPDEEEPGTWEENFKSFHDSKPNGPEAVALDFSFPEADVLFGIPEHADTFALKSTVGSEPYRLYNLDVFEYELDSPMALYGSVPVLYGHGSKSTVGVFWQNAAETWVDIATNQKNMVSSIVNFVSGTTKTEPPVAHFISESGIIDVFIMMGPTPLDAFKQYTDLTGTAPLPQVFALAYHQCRWNYNDQKDVLSVSDKFDEYDMPMDTMWLDIEYTVGKKYFTWDRLKFPDPVGMVKNLTHYGRHLTVIIDPHIKRESGYFFHEDCTNKGYYTKDKDGKDYEGWCWPGSASYPDLFNPEVRQYFADRYNTKNFDTVTNDVMIWNDMNEPSVFNGPEITMLKDNLHYGGWEHRDVHNLYGHMQLMSTYSGLTSRDPTQRPFILSRAHFAGSQRLATIWTGDNKADWEHLQHSIKMCLSESVAGFSFCGADVGGFFGNVEAELFQRWYQAAVFQPFLRSHAHIDTKRREPWLFPENTRLIIREALRKRYTYLPLWYTMFYEHEQVGYPVMRPLLAHYPTDKNAYAIDSEFLLQDKLLVRPVMQEGVNKVDVYFPVKADQSGDKWYDIDAYETIEKTGYVTIPVDDYKIPVYQRGGTIIPTKNRVRRASTLMKNDPYTLIICLDKNQEAKGTLYIDDEKSFEYRNGKFVYLDFEFKNGSLKGKFIGKANYKTKSWLERVVVAGFHKKPKSANIKYGSKSEKLEIVDVPQSETAFVIRKPGNNMGEEFEITLNLE